jgi:hypothetical protein
MLTGLKKSAKKSIGRILNRMGYIAFQKRNLDSYPLSKHLTDLFDLYKIDCVFDVGGNEGQYGTLLRDRVGYEGVIVSIVPVPEFAEKLRATLLGTATGWCSRQR